MVGFSFNQTTNKEEPQEQGQESLKKSKGHPLLLDHSLPESEDVSLSFVDSLLDFDDWFEEKSDPPFVDHSMADIGLDSAKGEVVEKSLEVAGDRLDLVNVEVVEKSLEVGGDGLDLVKVEVAKKSSEVRGTGACIESEIGDGVGKKIGDLGFVIEEEMKKVSLGGKIVGSAECEIEKGNGEVGADGNRFENGETLLGDEENGLKSGDVVNDEGESDGESESESANSSSSSSSSSDDEDEDEDKGKERNEKDEGREDVEEGEIREFEVEEIAAWSDDEGGGSVAAGPIRSKNEIQDLPPVPPVNATIEPHHQTLPVGVVLSMIGAQVIVEGVEKHNPLSEGSILWITESRSPLGLIDEIFGPVKNPYYIVRYNSESEVPSGIHQGSLISFVPEFAGFVLNDNSVYKKGYDASGENDEELSDEVEFSDDEKEAEYRRMQKMSKRATNDQSNGNMKNDKKKFKNRGGNWKNNYHQPSPTTQVQQDTVQQPLSHANSPRPLGPVQGNFPRPLGPVQGFPGGPGPTPTFQPAPQASNINAPSSGVWTNPVQGFPGGPGLTPTFQPAPQAVNFGAPSSGVWTNGIPCVHPQSTGMGFPNGLPANMPWMQQSYSQQPFQMPLPSGVPFPQQFNAGQMLPPNFVLQGQPNFFPGPSILPWPASMGQNVFNQPQFATGFPSPVAPPSMNVQQQGGVPNGPQVENNSGMRPPFAQVNSETSRNQSQGGYSNVQQQGGVSNGRQGENNSVMRPPFSQVNNETSRNPSQGGYSDRGGRQPFRRGGGGRFRGGRGGRQPRGRS